MLPRGPWYRGGTEELGYSVARAHAAACDVVVVTSAVDAPAPLPDEPFKLVLLHGRMALERPLSVDLLPLWHAIRWADAVHVHTPFPGVEVLAGLLARISGKPSLYTYHMDAISAHADGENGLGATLEKAYDRLSLRPALTLAGAIATHSLLYVDWSRVLPSYRTKLTVVHQGIRSDRVRAVDPVEPRRTWTEKIGASSDAVILGFIGRLVRYKGLHIAIPAFARLVKGGLDAHFVIGGEGPERGTLGALAETEGVGSRVHFVGFVPDEEIVSFYAACDVFASPSVSPLESTPITLLEAMAQGTAVIGTEVGGTAETVPDGGWNRIVKAGDVDALARALLELSRAARGAPKRPRYDRTWDDVAEDYRKMLFGGNAAD